jgi:hypothetical protein
MDARKRLAIPQRGSTKVQDAPVASTLKISVDHVTRRLDALSAGLKGRSGGLTFAETPLSAIPRFNWSFEASEATPLFKAPA